MIDMNHFNKVFGELREDESLYFAWQSNIAMAFFDQMMKEKRRPNRIKLLEICNISAKNFLNALIVKD